MSDVKLTECGLTWVERQERISFRSGQNPILNLWRNELMVYELGDSNTEILNLTVIAGHQIRTTTIISDDVGGPIKCDCSSVLYF